MTESQRPGHVPCLRLVCVYFDTGSQGALYRGSVFSTPPFFVRYLKCPGSVVRVFDNARHELSKHTLSLFCLSCLTRVDQSFFRRQPTKISTPTDKNLDADRQLTHSLMRAVNGPFRFPSDSQRMETKKKWGRYGTLRGPMVTPQGGTWQLRGRGPGLSRSLSNCL